MQKAQTITLVNALGSKLVLTNLGATLMGLYFKDRTGELINVVAGLKDAHHYGQPEYQKSQRCLGATIGRYAGRISKGGFNLDDTFYALTSKDNVQLHGGDKGFQNQLWQVVEVLQQPHPKAVFKLQDPAGEYPGNLTTCATYELSHQNQLSINYTATTDKTTVLNMANHAYFNLSGIGSVCDHLLQINADQILETHASLVPTGNFVDVAAADCDYRTSRLVGKHNFNGLDTVFVLGDKKPQVNITSPETGISMQISTNQKAMVVYTPDNFKGLDLAQPNTTAFPAICFEAQNFPDAPNQPSFPTSVLKPGETYQNLTRYKFTVE